MPLAGDDRDAKRVVADLSTRSASTPSTWGTSLTAGGWIQPGAPVYVAHMSAEEMRRRLAA